jgi:hypothetical protein
LEWIDRREYIRRLVDNKLTSAAGGPRNESQVANMAIWSSNSRGMPSRVGVVSIVVDEVWALSQPIDPGFLLFAGLTEPIETR